VEEVPGASKMKNTPIYLNDWAKDGFLQMVGDFEGLYLTREEFEATDSPWPNKEAWQESKDQMAAALASDKWKDLDILLASYGQGSYEGEAFVLFRKEGKLFEVHGSHCSCYGLEGQWEPEETTIESLEHRMAKGTLGDGTYCENIFAEDLRKVLDDQKKQQEEKHD
jgi:hypothetical protein